MHGEGSLKDLAHCGKQGTDDVVSFIMSKNSQGLWGIGPGMEIMGDEGRLALSLWLL